MRNFKLYFYNIFFLLGWGIFYLFEFSIVWQFFSFSSELNPVYSFSYILIYSLANFALMICYSVIFVKYLKSFFCKTVNLEQKKALIAKSCTGGIILIYTLLLIIVFLTIFGV